MAPPFDVAEVTLDTARGERRALVATPTRHLRIKPGDLKRDDRVDFRPDPVATRAQEARGDAKLMIFRGKDDVGQGSWAIDGTVDEGQAAAVGEELVRWHLPTWRTLAADGIVLLVHLDLDERTCLALEAGKRIVSRELRLKSRTEGTLANDVEEARARLDLWLLQHLVFFFGLSYERAVTSTLPDMMPMLEQRQGALGRLLAELPPTPAEPDD